MQNQSRTIGPDIGNEILTRQCGLMEHLTKIYFDLNSNANDRSLIEEIYRKEELAALDVATMIPIDKVSARSIAATGSAALMRCIPAASGQTQVLPTMTNPSALEFGGPEFAGLLAQHFALGSQPCRTLIRLAEQDPAILPVLEKVMLNIYNKAEMCSSWADHIDLLFRAAPNVAPRVLYLQAQAFPAEFADLTDKIVNQPGAAEKTILLLSLGFEIPGITLADMIDKTYAHASAHERIEHLRRAQHYTTAAHTPWP